MLFISYFVIIMKLEQRYLPLKSIILVYTLIIRNAVSKPVLDAGKYVISTYSFTKNAVIWYLKAPIYVKPLLLTCIKGIEIISAAALTRQFLKHSYRHHHRHNFTSNSSQQYGHATILINIIVVVCSAHKTIITVDGGAGVTPLQTWDKEVYCRGRHHGFIASVALIFICHLHICVTSYYTLELK